MKALLIPPDRDREASNTGARWTLDGMLRGNAARRPNATALIDPSDCENFLDRPPRRLTYLQTDRVISAIAARLRQIGLSTDSIVGIQLPNTVDGILAILGVLRAGMIAAPLPLLWRRANCVAALSRVGAKALMTCGPLRGFNYSELATQVAAEIFSIRYVCGFGAALADGITSFDDLYDLKDTDVLPSFETERERDPAHPSVITFDVAADGVVPVARNEAELIAGGLAVTLQSGIAADATLLASTPPSSFAGLSLTLTPWLLSGGTLVLHQPFDAGILLQQIIAHRCDVAILPGTIIPPLADSGLLSIEGGPRTLIALWRSPERLAASAPWRNTNMTLFDVSAFGEIVVATSPRDPAGYAVPLPLGSVTAPHSNFSEIDVLETARSENGTLALRGPMVPRQPFPPGAEHSRAPYFKVAADGFTDSGYGCRAENGVLVLTGPPAGIANVGAYRFALRDIQDTVSGLGGAVSIAALPDAFSGSKLAGQADNASAVRHALTAMGVNPLLVRAFRARRDRSDIA